MLAQSRTDNQWPVFNPDVRCTRGEIVAAARRYLGLRYNLRSTYAQERDQRMVGAADCLGLLLLVARDLGYLPPGFDINLHRPRAADGHTKMSAKEAVYHGLRHNLIETAEPRPGEFLLFLEEIDNAPYHMAIMTCEADTGAPNGWMIHAINHRVSRELGGVVEVPISAIMQRQLLSAWQLPGVDD